MKRTLFLIAVGRSVGKHIMRVLSILVFSAFMAFGTTSPAFAEAVFMGPGDLPGRG